MAARINPAKIKQEADRLEKAGQLEKAIALFRQVIDDNPQDWNTINKVGDLYAKLNRNRDAAGEYAKVADYYAKDGFLLKAIAIWKKINKLDSTALEPYVNLAELYAKQGLMMEAKGQYQIIVDEYVRRGKLRDAGEILRRMADIDPADLKIRSKLADLYTREGNSAKAIEEHIAIADELNKKGHLAEALQVLEKGLKIGPQNPKLRAELARIHLLQKNYDKAVQYLEETVQQTPNDVGLLTRLGEAYLGAKKLEEAQAIFRRLIELDPHNQDARAQMGRLHLLQGQFDRAYDELVPIVDGLVAQRDSDRAVALLQQITQRNPDHIKSLIKIADVYRLTGKESLTALTYSQLTEAYIRENRFAEAAAILETLVSLEPQNQQHRTKLAFVRERQTTGRRAPAPPAPAPTFNVEEEEEFDLDQPVASPFAPAPFPAPSAAPFRPARTTPVPTARPTIEPSGPLSPEDREFLDEHMAEGRVFRKYGLLDKALDQFEAIVARFADHLEARRELVDLYKEKGPPDKAAEHSLALAEIYRLRGDVAAAEACETAVKPSRRAAPAAARPAAPPLVSAPAAAAPPAARRAPTVETHDEIPIDLDSLGLGEAPSPGPEPMLEGLDLGEEGEALPEHFVEEEAPRAEAEEFDVSLPLDLEPPPPPPPSPRRAPAPLPARLDARQPFALDEELEFPLPEPVAPAPPARARARPPAAPAPPSFEDDLLGALPPPEPPPPPVRAPAAPRARVQAAPAQAPSMLGLEEILGEEPPLQPGQETLPPDLERVLGDVDQSLTFGFVDEAKEALRHVGARYPGHPAILDKLDQIGLDRELAETPSEEVSFDLDSLGAPSAPPSPMDGLGALGAPVSGPAPTPDTFDLGAELDDLFGAQPAVQEPPAGAPPGELGDPALAQIFEEFKKGVDQQLGKEDYDTRYNLGIAYKEMGLIDEAIAEFQLAAKDDGRLLECSSMLGLCFMEKGMPKLAVKWFEKGLKAPGRLDEEYQGLRYDLAAAHEASGDLEASLRIYSDIFSQDASFRDVGAKVRNLRKALGR